jgi:AraC-like DNA-binding protein
MKDELRRDLAIGLLDGGAPVERVAERVGFSDSSAFTRAFKAWTGVAPGRYRR